MNERRVHNLNTKLAIAKISAYEIHKQDPIELKGYQKGCIFEPLGSGMTRFLLFL
jgi:hypothetical protein